MKKLIKVAAGGVILANPQGLGVAIHQQQDNNPIPNSFPEGVDNSANNTLADIDLGDPSFLQAQKGFEGSKDDETLSPSSSLTASPSPSPSSSLTASPSPSPSSSSTTSSSPSPSSSLTAPSSPSPSSSSTTSPSPSEQHSEREQHSDNLHPNHTRDSSIFIGSTSFLGAVYLVCHALGLRRQNNAMRTEVAGQGPQQQGDETQSESEAEAGQELQPAAQRSQQQEDGMQLAEAVELTSAVQGPQPGAVVVGLEASAAQELQQQEGGIMA